MKQNIYDYDVSNYFKKKVLNIKYQYAVLQQNNYKYVLWIMIHENNFRKLKCIFRMQTQPQNSGQVWKIKIFI